MKNVLSLNLQAKGLGDFLVAGVHSDGESVKWCNVLIIRVEKFSHMF